MTTRLEHANVAVRDVDQIIQFLQTAFPDFAIRGEGKNAQGKRWVHIGNEDTYLALNEAPEAPPTKRAPYSAVPGMNHLGYEVSDVSALRERMRDAGYFDSTVPNDHPNRARVYFYDPEGNDWEFVEYNTDDPHLRNDYSLADPPIS